VGTSGGGRRHGCANHSLTPNAAAQRLPRDGPAGHGTRVSTHLENASVDDRMQNPVPRPAARLSENGTWSGVGSDHPFRTKQPMIKVVYVTSITSQTTFHVFLTLVPIKSNLIAVHPI
jgi:hypothetical protein